MVEHVWKISLWKSKSKVAPTDNNDDGIRCESFLGKVDEAVDDDAPAAEDDGDGGVVQDGDVSGKR